MSSEIAVPFALGLNGKVVVEPDPDRQIAQHVRSLVSTEPGERLMLAGYGVATTSLVFEPDDDMLQSMLLTDVTNAFRQWEPGLVIRDVLIAGTNSGDGLAGVKVDYQRADSADTGLSARHVNTAVISVGGRVNEVIRG